MVSKNRNKRHGKKRHRPNAKNRNPGATDNQDHTQVRGWSQLVEGELIWNSLTLTSTCIAYQNKKLTTL